MAEGDVTIKDEVAAWAGASDKLRDVVKWTATSFGALGALLIGTAPLSGLDKVEPTFRTFMLLALCAALAMGGVGFVIWRSTSLLAPSMVTLTDVLSDNRYANVRRLIASEPQAFLGTWGTDVDSFLANRAQEFRLLTSVDQRIVREPNPDDVRALKDLRDKLVARIESLGRVSQRLLAVAQFSELSGSFKEARPKLFAGAAAVVVGTAAYLTVLGTSSSEATDTQPTTLPALVVLTGAGKVAVGPLLGDSCPSPFHALVLDGGSKGPWELLVTDPACTAGKVNVTVDQAAVLLSFSR